MNNFIIFALVCTFSLPSLYLGIRSECYIDYFQKKQPIYFQCCCFMNKQYKFRLVYKKFLGTVFNMHFAMHFIMKGYMLPISMMANISLLTSPDVDTRAAT